jgi:Fe-S-cluster containining protein
MTRPSTETIALDVPDREALADLVTIHTCLRKCMGHDDLAAGCCTVGSRDYIIGPIHDTAALLERLSERYGRDVPYEEVFVDHEEGSGLFPDRPVWQRKECFPAIRVDMDDPLRSCRFLADDNLCSIHDIRSNTCRDYSCSHLKAITDML